MIDKKEFFRLLGAKNNIDSYLFWMFHYWYHKNNPDLEERGPFYNIVDVVGCPTEDTITLRFDNDEKCEYTIPLSSMHEKDDTPAITMLWYSNYYDGPLSGLAEYKGERVWFDCVEWEDNPWQMRTFGLYKMSAKELAYEDKWHALWNKLVGYRCDFGVDKENIEETNSDEYFRLAEKEDRKNKTKDYTKNECLGIFDESFIGRKQPPDKSIG